MKKLWKKIKYVLGIHPTFTSIKEILDYVRVGDIYVLSDIIKRYPHVSVENKGTMLEQAEFIVKEGYGDCGYKMALAAIIFTEWGWYNKCYYFKSEKPVGHAVLYFDNDKAYGYMSNGELFTGLEQTDTEEILDLVGSSNNTFYIEMRDFKWNLKK